MHIQARHVLKNTTIHILATEFQDVGCVYCNKYSSSNNTTGEIVAILIPNNT
jgi:hypothetical protein